MPAGRDATFPPPASELAAPQRPLLNGIISVLHRCAAIKYTPIAYISSDQDWHAESLALMMLALELPGA